MLTGLSKDVAYIDKGANAAVFADQVGEDDSLFIQAFKSRRWRFANGY